jgi:L-cysteine:1D-myo-inositol 2-amino-2-deoxy-alpha-D-glucopyranoside ligase
LSKLDYAEMLRTANERGNDPDDPNKRDPLDFVLWQAAKPGEPTWDSPWGLGRPGWHIECSAMSMRYLGPTVDIHGGGADLIFPHHESEIAQSEHYTGVKPFVRIWMHTGMVRLGHEKMSKSLGNLVMVHDVLKRYSADALRLYLLSFPYRSSWAYTEEGVAQAEALAQQLREAAQSNGHSDSPALDPGPWRERFLAAMDNDLNTPEAITALRDLANAIREARAQGGNIERAQAALRELAGVLGLTLARRP